MPPSSSAPPSSIPMPPPPKFCALTPSSSARGIVSTEAFIVRSLSGGERRYEHLTKREILISASKLGVPLFMHRSTCW
eukprot:scaffold33109_cov63-Phaeocystis_antarctica.AAC.2